MTNIRKKGFALLALVMVLTLLLTFVLVACGEKDTQTDKEYSLTFDPNYEGAEPTTVNIKANDAESYPAPSRDGYTFVGWTFDKLGKVPFDKYRLESGMTIYAQWSKIVATMYTVRFLDHEGKNVISTQQVEAGNAAIEPKESEYSSFIPSGYLFDGWDKSFDDINADTDVTMLIKEEQITPPPVVNEYTVRFFDPSGEELLAKRTVKEGEGATPPPASVLEGYFDPAKEAFSHWVTLDGQECDITNITANLDVKMVVISTVEIVTVTFKNGDEIITSFDGEVGMGIPQKVDAPSKDGFNFYRFETVDGKVFDENSKFSANETYFATWTIATPTTPAIVLDKDAYVYGESIALSLGGKVEHAGISYTYEWLDEKDAVLASGLTYQATNRVVGTHSFKIRVTASAQGYTSASATSIATLVSVGKASLTATVQSASVVYGDNSPSQYNIVLSGFAYGEDEGVVDKSSLAFDCTYTAGLGIGNYNVSASGLSADNYDITYSNGTLTVTQKDIAISKQDSAVYAKVAIEKHYDNLTNIALLDGHVLSLVVKTNSANVGVYKNTDSINNLSSTVSIVDKDGVSVIANYNVSVATTFEITPATIAYTMPSNLEFTYNANSHSATLSDVTDNIQVLYSVDGTNYSTSVPTFVNAGSYKVYAKMSRANYADEETSFVIVINRADVTISANSLTTTYGKAFKQSDLTYTASIAGNFDVTLSTDYAQGASVGTYDITVDVKDDANFNITTVDSTITVEKAQLVATISNASIVYGEDFTPTTSLVTLEGLLLGDDAMLTMSTTYTLGDGVGKYAISCESANTNYAFTAEDGTLSVTKRALSVTIGSQNIVYGQNYQELEHSITAGSLALEDSYTIEDMTAYVVGGNYGTYPLHANVVIANDKGDNYDVTVVDGTLNVAQYAITLTIQKPANIAYGDAKPEFAYTLDKEVVAGDVISVDYTTTYTVGSDAGKYNVGAIATFANGDDDKTDNYAIKYNPTSFDVAKRFITITMATPLASYYGDPLNKIDYAITSGEFASCDEVAITPSHADATNAGRYQVGANIVINNKAFSGSHVNYDITIVNSVLEVLPRPVTVTLNGAILTYGEEFVAEATVGGMLFVDSDKAIVTPTTTYSAGASIGKHEVSAQIIVGGVDSKDNGNYSVTIVKGEVNVSPIELTISANEVPSIVYGDSAPSEYTHTIVGTPYAMDKVVVTTTCYYTQGNDIGEYPIINTISITRDGRNVSGNYIVTNNDTILLVEPRPITYILPDIEVTYGDSFVYPVDQIVIHNLCNNENPKDVISVEHNYTPILSKPGVGYVGVTSVGNRNANYTFSDDCSTGYFTVKQKPLTLKIDDISIYYGDDTPTFTYSVEGSLVGTDSIFEFVPTCDYDKQTTGVGLVYIYGSLVIKNGEDDVTGCYYVTEKEGELTINARPITITYSTYHKQDGNAVSFAITNDMVSNAHAKDTFSGTLTTIDSINGIYSTFGEDFSGTIEINDENGWVNPINYVITYNFNVEIAASDIGCTSTSYVGTYDGNPHTGSVTPAIDGVTVTYGLSEGVYDLSEIPTFTNAGAYTVYFKASKAEMTDYFGSFTVTINKKSATLAFNKTLTYGDDYSIPSLAEIVGLSQDEIDELGLAIDCGGYTNGASAGTYNVTFSYNDANGNFDITNNGGSIVINKKAIIVTFEDAYYVVVYGDEFAMPNYTVSDNLDSVVSVSTDYAPGANVGKYLINVTTTDETNYTITAVNNGVIDVIARPIRISDVENITITYGEAVSAPITTEYIRNKYEEDTVEVFPFETQDMLSVGTYTFQSTHKITRDGVDVSGNYQVENKPVTVVVSPYALTIKADDTSLNYGSTVPENFTYTLIDCSLNGSEYLYVTTSTSYKQGDNAGTYAITLSSPYVEREGKDNSHNYTFNLVGGTLTIDKVAITVEFASQTVEYGTFVDVDGSKIVSPSIYSNVVVLESTHTQTSPVGTYAVTCKLLNDNYVVTSTIGNITVTTRTITLNVDNVYVQYGDEIDNINYSASYEDALKYVVIEPLYSVGDGVGTYAFNVSLNASAEGRYVLDLDNSTIGNIIVSKKTIVVTPEDLTKVYDGVEPTIKFTSTDLVGNDTLDITFSGIDNVNVGTYTVCANAITHDNYVIDNSASATLTINPRPVKVTANDVKVDYNNPTPSITFSTDFEGANEFITVSAPSYTVGNNAGNYPLVANVSGSDNFTISADSVLGNLVVEPVKVTVSVDNTSVVYGEAWTAPTFTTDPASAHDYFTITTTYTVGSGVGEYAYIFTSSNQNYVVSANTGKLTVTPAELTITFDEQHITYGDAIPNRVDCTITGLIPQDEPNMAVFEDAVYITTTYQAGFNAGAYTFSIDKTRTVFDNYTYVVAGSNAFIVDKATLAPSHPAFTNVVYNPTSTLATLTLNAGYSWVDETALIGDCPEDISQPKTFRAKFNETVNYYASELDVLVYMVKANATISHNTTLEADWISGGYTLANLIAGVASDGSAITYDITNAGMAQTNATTIVDGGVYAITIKSAGSRNYNPATKNVTVKIKSASLNGVLYTVEDALASGGTITLTGNAFVSSNVEVKSGTTLILPSTQDTSTTIGTPTHGAGSGGYVDNDNYVEHKLTILNGVNVTVNGNILINGLLGREGAGQSGHTSGKHSRLINNGTMTFNSGANFDVRGYVKGTGAIIYNSGVTVYAPFVVIDFKGGSATYAYKNAEVSGFSIYEMPNVQAPQTIRAGSTIVAYCDLYASSKHNTTQANVIASSNALLNMSSGSVITMTYSSNGTTNLTLDGSISAGALSLSVNAGITVTVKTSDYVFPISYKFNIVVNSGTFTVPYRYSLMPGASLTVNPGATILLQGSKSSGWFSKTVYAGIMVYDNTFADPDNISPYPSNKGDAKFIVNGTLNAQQYTQLGGLIQSTQSGAKVIIGTDFTNNMSRKLGYSEGSSLLASLTQTGTYTVTAQLQGGITPAASTTYTYNGTTWA